MSSRVKKYACPVAVCALVGLDHPRSLPQRLAKILPLETRPCSSQSSNKTNTTRDASSVDYVRLLAGNQHDAPPGIDTLDPARNPISKHQGPLSSVSQVDFDAQTRPSFSAS
ncbi:hypothetical protein NUU61_004988 [Penicillium alfredii]|uniref:Uncharacterized protein n=1 Tax=Penicillium alfredii TaxID=1506179 RepID=A0A9W9F8Z3_9EURO|nr:uncharacterized protein NUU61_004988 [Penicillium alfredii]KAJ5095632.1 hypothetical protein NUU61_004988 [Penicillium alfredii]